nr:MAG TPA: hypothetical protein [Caudoviricetes sp.]DAR43899.1 MAG TPA: hypothetical protein [Caudoviricetes sp.]
MIHYSVISLFYRQTWLDCHTFQLFVLLVCHIYMAFALPPFFNTRLV